MRLNVPFDVTDDQRRQIKTALAGRMGAVAVYHYSDLIIIDLSTPDEDSAAKVRVIANGIVIGTTTLQALLDTAYSADHPEQRQPSPSGTVPR